MTDLASLFAPPRPGPSQAVSYRQGRIETWDVLTANNSVDVGGTILTDLPVLNTSEALLLSPGDVVAIAVIESTARGAKTYAILGRITIPGSAASGTALNVLGAFIRSANVDASDTITSTSYAAAPTNPGPAVTVDVRSSGKVLVLLTALMQATDAAQVTHMSFAISGATTAAAATNRSLQLGAFGEGAGTNTHGRIGATVYVDGLNAGSTTFTAEYRKTAAGGTAVVDLRNITVIPL